MSSIRAKSKSFAADVLSKSFKPEKCKTSLKMAVARIKLLRNKREAQVRHMRRDLAQLLESGQDQTARIRVEHVIREEKTMSAYELIELYCELIVARLPIIESQKSCPIDLKEAIASVLFASPRCADVPELMDVRKHFTAKYGKDFINSALEVRPDCGVNRMVVEKLSARAPDIETKIKTLTSIAQENNVKWNSKAFEEELHKPEADLLDGPKTFASNNNFPKEVSNIKLPPEPYQKNGTAEKFENDVSKSTSFSGSHRNTNTPSIPPSEYGDSVNMAGNREAGYSYSREDNGSLKRSNWNLEFKDATSAAQAAAESAERASMAARAAAELASRGNVSGSYPTGSHESPTYIRDQGPVKSVKSMSSKPKVEHITDETIVIENDELTHPQVRQGARNLQRDEPQIALSKQVPERTNDTGEDVRRRSSSRSPSLSSEASIQDDISEFNLQKADEAAHGHAQSFFAGDSMRKTTSIKKHENDEFDQRINSYSKSKFDDDTTWDSNFNKAEDADGQNSSTGTGRMDIASSHKEPAFGGNFAAVFDDYGSDDDDNFVYKGYSEGYRLDSFLSHQRKEPSVMSSSADLWSSKQERSGSLKKVDSFELPRVFEKNERQEVAHLSRSNYSRPVAFDDSDGFDSESEDKMDQEAVESDHLLHTQRSFTGDSLSAESGHILTTGSLNEKEVAQAKMGSSLLVFSNAHRENSKPDLSYGDKSWNGSGSHSLIDNQPSPRNERVTRNSSSSGRGLLYHPKDEWLPNPGASEVSSIDEEKPEVKFEMPSSPSSSNDSEPVNDSRDSNWQSLNLRRLTGGFKNKGFSRPPYLQSPLVDPTFSSQQSSDDAPSISKKSSLSDKSSANSEILDEEKYDHRSSLKSNFSKYSDGASFSANKAAADSPSITKNFSHLRQDSISGKQGIPVQESSSHISRRKDHSKYSSESSMLYSDPDSNEQHSHAGGSRSYKEIASTSPTKSTNSSLTNEKPAVTHGRRILATADSKQAMYDKMPSAKGYKELSPKVQSTYFDKENDEVEELGSRNIRQSRGTLDSKLSRRTRGSLSESKKGDRSGLADQLNVPNISELERRPSQTSSLENEPPAPASLAIDSEGKKTSQRLQPKSAVEHPSFTPSKIENPNSSQIESKQSLSTSLSGCLTARETSFKKASHVHPKLPDYDSLAAHFQSLRANRRTE